MNLFENTNVKKDNNDRPLAYRMRPRSLDEFYGQEEIVGDNKLLSRAIKADRLQSLIFYGPPGTGKTSLAQVIANQTEAEFVKLNAVTSGVKDIREVIKKAKSNRNLYNNKTILFIDEIHRFNKSQQDALLPSVENGTVIMIGATTENPYFEVNSPLLSRSRIFRLEKLKSKQVLSILEKSLEDEKRGLGKLNVNISNRDLQFIAELADGDARVALNTLELAVLTTPANSDGIINLNTEIIEDSMQKKILNYDRSGDNHYDIISAFIKSMRGSDPDAAIYWLARMIVSGEDPKFIARRVVIHAAEDVGMADPTALIIAESAARAVEQIGFPEAKIPLAEAVIYIASAPKSNSVVKAINSAVDYVENNKAGSVPAHLKDSHYAGASDLGHGIEYKYPHSYPKNYIEQNYLPEDMQSVSFYEPGKMGREKKTAQFLKYLRNENGTEDD
ncbi:MAG: putative ATPase [Halanaerobium sp. 4-GBenrich]|jgi:putative ATPase|uniref:Replication-associated recombination protein A n=1 Tax=Halanaerobium congolense TaxID=54121 RepID=A0A1G6PL45_9FIRM|nr:replication-associated recombination protein A [Halanaerobium congolense]KXS48638.1 MAG: putative ATPase [Halanaerobium sp. T82-1]ODS49694.1 MAG: putative ATPase [Halanaerobium sp. 4-GBenrich]OEG62329.1 MAG: AAA family ATPase [Halanaerobium sp. MDAL1]PUU92705.1 MAG: putative ATPase [Halanaerobium sp.]PTX16824.1 putative ATPase [Halanaerobium congolense]